MTRVPGLSTIIEIISEIELGFLDGKILKIHKYMYA